MLPCHFLFNEGKIDVHIPQADTKELAYIYSEDALWSSNFIINDEKLKIYSDYVQYNLFDFGGLPISNIENAIQIVNKHRIDGVIYASNIICALVKDFINPYQDWQPYINES